MELATRPLRIKQRRMSWKEKMTSVIPVFGSKSQVASDKNSNAKDEPRPCCDNTSILLKSEDPDEISIYLCPQDIIIEFTVSAVDTMKSFIYKGYHQLSEKPVGTSVKASQIIRPFCDHLECPISDAIVHYFREDSLHLRIASTQLTKFWPMTERGLHPMTIIDRGESWIIGISNQNSWSTNIL